MVCQCKLVVNIIISIFLSKYITERLNKPFFESISCGEIRPYCSTKRNILSEVLSFTPLTYRQTDRQTGRQASKQTDTQTHRHTDRHTDSQTHRHTDR